MPTRCYFLCLGIVLGITSISYASDNNSQFNSSVIPLSTTLQQQLITAKLWHAGCPVQLSDLRLVSVKYYDFDGNTHVDGEIILDKIAASAATQAFAKLYADKFPFAAIDTLIKFNADWHAAEQKNITYGFVCTKNADNKFSPESYGTVITVNPVQNPQLNLIQQKNSKKSFWCTMLSPLYHCNDSIGARVEVFPSAGMLAIDRGLKLKGMTETAVSTFATFGFIWSGHKAEIINWKKFVFNPSKSTK